MKISLKQKTTYDGDNWWKWSVWVEGEKEILNRIEYVEYALHNSFPQPVRRVEDRSSKFRLDSEGWGEFMIRAQVIHKDGSKKSLKRWLELKSSAEGDKQDDETSEAAGGGGVSGEGLSRSIFFSCNIADAPFANALSKALGAHGARVLMMGNETSGLPWEVSINQLLNQADVAVFIISESMSTWMKRELAATLERKIPIIPLLLSSKVKLSELPDKTEKAIQVKPVEPEKYEEEAQGLAKRILQAVEKLMSSAIKKEAAKS
jgi:transcription initiation factor IIF auxiliary subunit